MKRRLSVLLRLGSRNNSISHIFVTNDERCHNISHSDDALFLLSLCHSTLLTRPRKTGVCTTIAKHESRPTPFHCDTPYLSLGDVICYGSCTIRKSTESAIIPIEVNRRYMRYPTRHGLSGLFGLIRRFVFTRLNASGGRLRQKQTCRKWTMCRLLWIWLKLSLGWASCVFLSSA